MPEQLFKILPSYLGLFRTGKEKSVSRPCGRVLWTPRLRSYYVPKCDPVTFCFCNAIILVLRQSNKKQWVGGRAHPFLYCLFCRDSRRVDCDHVYVQLGPDRIWALGNILLYWQKSAFISLVQGCTIDAIEHHFQVTTSSGELPQVQT